ncbi:MBL fold metallo-hydrolase [Segetibacter sp.]|uniref:MBL fold metallo-hydrolase RNA specificity domain-containing protein n=1 Tax=Segetibacter sp. TaxID=2231182 RepID=UPI002616F98F|nr:MBL fold metallo-hydrolase [Segetibacter sp.]MCW3080375.1 metallo-beta-lactamase family protein RNA-specific [Segetibacter sp.]
MQLSFHGAARSVTGSKHLLTLKNGKRLLLDCGLFQGMGRQTDELNSTFGFSAKDVTYLVLSHAHIDHSGLIPKLYSEGFRGSVFCTPATKDLCQILLMDSAEIQQSDTKYINKKRTKLGLPLFKPMYSIEDAKRCLELFTTAEHGKWFRIDNDIKVLFTDAGHIIGSAAVSLQIMEEEETTHITFSGDVGRYNDAILKAPEEVPQADYIIMESTYGNRLHKEVKNTPDSFLSWIEKTCIEKKGKLIIPAFSVGRTQELLYALNKLDNENRLPAIKFFVDSPLSREATDVIRKHPENFNKELQAVLLHDKDPFDFKGLNYIKTAEESKQINSYNHPCVIISSSGMAEAGRVKHHIKNNIEDEKNTILMVGYASPYSLAGKLLNGAKRVNIYGDDYVVNAEVGSMSGISAHGDYEDLFQFLSGQDTEKVKKIFLVHGEYDVQTAFAKRLQEKGFEVEIPGMNYALDLTT